MLRILLILLLSFYSIKENLNQNETLNIAISNISSFEGEIQVSVYNEQNDFLSLTDIYKYHIFVPSQKIEAISFDLPPGKYAVATFHDLDKDGKMDKNILGIPKEPYGFSNNFKLRMSAPKFEDCMIVIRENETAEIEIQLQNY